jgi:hypothetical protein
MEIAQNVLNGLLLASARMKTEAGKAAMKGLIAEIEAGHYSTAGLAHLSSEAVAEVLYQEVKARVQRTQGASQGPAEALFGQGLFGGEEFLGQAPMNYANFGQRVGAWLIDALILAIPSLILSPIPLLSLLVGWLIFALQESSPTQATIGKKTLGLYVTNLNGERLSFGQATGRYFSQILSALILGIGYLFCLWTEKKQCLHDQIASTLVLSKDKA